MKKESTLERSEGRFRSLMEMAPDGIIAVDRECRIALANRAAYRIFGYVGEELIGQPLAILIPELRGENNLSRLRELLLDRDAGKTEIRPRLIGRKKDAGQFPVDLSLGPLGSGEGPQVVAIIRDMTESERLETERRSLEAQLFQGQKMESIGRLTGGIAHDFNNILSIISGYSEMSLQYLEKGDPLRENLQEIKEAADRAIALTDQLLSFSRKQVLQPKRLNPNDVLGPMNRMLQHLIGASIKLEIFLDPELGQVVADPNRLQQVILNLATNARDAMPQGGRLTIETQNIGLDQEYADRHVDVKPGPYVMLAVSDTGPGMEAETLSHLFEPFFTTKERGRGTGLGLSIVYGIVKQIGGHARVSSEPGHGTSFKIYLPRVEAETKPEPVQAGVASRVGTSEGHETVLVAEDEEKLRELIQTLLQRKGYTVLTAASGQEALSVSGSFRKPIPLLITDIVMPGMSGRDLAERLVLKRPGIKVLYISGYTDDVIIRHGVLKEGTHFLKKPFSPGALLQKIREVLD